MWYVGIDPGSPLYVALVNEKGQLIAKAEKERVAIKQGNKWNNSPELLAGVLKEWQAAAYAKDQDLTAVVERVGPHPGEGVVSACKFVGSMWMAWGAIAARDIPIVKVTPAKWKRHFGLKGGTENKDLSRQKALGYWPKKSAWFKYKYSHNLAEAALLARYGKDMG